MRKRNDCTWEEWKNLSKKAVDLVDKGWTQNEISKYLNLHVDSVKHLRRKHLGGYKNRVYTTKRGLSKKNALKDKGKVSKEFDSQKASARKRVVQQIIDTGLQGTMISLPYKWEMEKMMFKRGLTDMYYAGFENNPKLSEQIKTVTGFHDINRNEGFNGDLALNRDINSFILNKLKKEDCLTHAILDYYNSWGDNVEAIHKILTEDHIRPGGIISVWTYPRMGLKKLYEFNRNHALRKVANKLDYTFEDQIYLHIQLVKKITNGRVKCIDSFKYKSRGGKTPMLVYTFQRLS